jgi:small-conductance mechanosensitive channel
MHESQPLLHYPLIRLAGTEIKLGALVVGVVIVLAALFVSALFGRAVRRMLAKRGLGPGTQLAASKVTRYVLVVGKRSRKTKQDSNAHAINRKTRGLPR